MAEEVPVKDRYSIEAEREAAKARERALRRARERNAVSEGFKTHTEGEKRFNDLTYTAVGYFGVTALSVFMTYLFRHTEPLKTHFNSWADSLTKSATFLYKNNPEKRKSFYQSALTVGALFTGGSIATIFGVKTLEDNKAKIVKKFDEQIYGKDVVDNDPEIQASHTIMEAQPKQTWASVAGSRVTAFLGTLGALVLIGANGGWLSKRLHTSFDTMGVQFGRWGASILNSKNKTVLDNLDEAVQINRKADRNMRSLVPGKDTFWTQILSYLGTDALYTVITAAGLFISTRMLAPIFDKNGLDTFSKKDGELHQGNTKERTKLIPIDQLEGTPEDTKPHVKVSHVESVGRMQDTSNTQHAGASV